MDIFSYIWLFIVQAPEGSVAKITGKEGLVFKGVAKVYDSEELMMAGLNRKEITKGGCIIMSENNEEN